MAAESVPTLGDRHRIDPAGIPGSLVLSGDDVSADALQSLLRRGEKERLVILRGSRGGVRAEGITDRLTELVKSSKPESVDVVTVGQDVPETTANLARATAVWIAAEDPDDAANILTKPVREALRTAMQGGASVGASGQVAASLAAYRVASSSDVSSPTVLAGLGLLPDAIVRQAAASEDSGSPLDGLVQRHPGHVGYELPSNGALVVQGRRLGVVGDGSVRIVLPKCDWRDGHEQTLRGSRSAADLTALRFAAIDRFLPAFPTQQPPPPNVAKGTLIIIGGGGFPEGIVERFVELAGGEEARIVVLEPIPTSSPMADRFRNAGAASVKVLSGSSRSVVDGEVSLDALRKATGLWFGGGRQWRFADAYLGTRAHALMHDVLRRDGVIMGSSAGASIQTDYLARANPLGNRDIMAEGYERGLGFLPGVAVDQHFAQRRRFQDMTSLVDRHPQLLGIGIDEATAIVVQGRMAEVVGRSEVHFYDRSRPTAEGQPDYLSLAAGSVYDLVDRRRVETKKAEEPASMEQ